MRTNQEHTFSCPRRPRRCRPRISHVANAVGGCTPSRRMTHPTNPGVIKCPKPFSRRQCLQLRSQLQLRSGPRPPEPMPMHRFAPRPMGWADQRAPRAISILLRNARRRFRAWAVRVQATRICARASPGRLDRDDAGQARPAKWAWPCRLRLADTGGGLTQKTRRE